MKITRGDGIDPVTSMCKSKNSWRRISSYSSSKDLNSSTVFIISYEVFFIVGYAFEEEDLVHACLIIHFPTYLKN